VVAFGISGCGLTGGIGSESSAISGNCGNGHLDPGEQCDDGNNTNLDGCDSTCHFEQIQRFNSLSMVFGPDAMCTVDALGSAIAGAAQSTVQGDLTKNVASGGISALFDFRGLTDLSGASSQTFSVGSMAGFPMNATGGSYNGASDLDWWYAAAKSSVDANRTPIAQISASISGGVFTAGPGNVNLPLSFGGGTSNIALSNVQVSGTLGPATTLTMASSTVPPGHRASENDVAGLTTFGTLTAGEM
jgi:cysteine-rich repeat protein